MTYPSFFAHLTWVSVLAAICIFLQQLIPAVADYLSVSWISLAVFGGLSIIMFIISHRSVHSQNKGQFISLFMGFTLLKMLAAVCIILLYNQYATPMTNLFVFPFFIIYLIYTAFEIWFMTRLGRMNVS